MILLTGRIVLISLLANIEICDNVFCSHDHHSKINDNYVQLVYALKAASRSFVQVGVKKFKPVPGWNAYCKNKYKMSRSDFLNWIEHGKPRVGYIFEKMKESRKIFVKALNFCKRNRETISNNIIVEIILLLNLIIVSDPRTSGRKLGQEEMRRIYMRMK